MRQKLNEISSAQFYNKPIQVRCIISGKSLAPYYVPKTITIKCRGSVACGENCKYKKSTTLELEPVSEAVLMFIDIKTNMLMKAVREAFHISCEQFSVVVDDVQNIERVFISQITGKDRDKWGAARIAYYVGHGIDINSIYQLTGYTTVDPMNQTVTHVFREAEKVKSDIESFELTPKLHHRLQELSIPNPTIESIYEKLEEIYKFYAHNITKIYKRFLLHLSIDLAFHSVMSFYLDHEYIHKGWADVMVVGDPRCGKGFVAERLVKYYGVGEVVGADNTSFAGLVAGLQQYNKHWVVTWGKIPMNDGGLVVVDESSEIKDEVWSRLSRIRSEGIAEVTKIQSQTTNARTRMIWIANPPHKTISNYSYGIQALMDIVKTPEDIARFDYVCVVAHDEVPIEEINSSKSVITSLYPKQLERDLILWIWSRTKDQVYFTERAVKLIYKLSIRLASKYDFSIPLIQGENIRVKLAKIAISFAGRFYSHSDNGERLRVDAVHVECASVFLNLLYKTDANGYYIYSQLRRSTDTEYIEENIEKIHNYFDAFGSKKEDVYRCLLMNNNITIIDLIEHLNQPREVATEMISKLLKHNCIIRKHTYYVKTPPFTLWLKKRVLT